MSLFSKTRRRTVVDISGGFPGLLSDRSDQFVKFLSTHSDDAFSRPWHRLERGLRLNRLRLFVKEEGERYQFTEEEQSGMFQTLTKALDKKLLNSKSVVNYDQDQQKILEIKGLTFHRQADGRTIVQFKERKTGTIRKKSVAAGQQPSEQPSA